jgi:osmotically-inducible protein OsmY
MRRYQKWALALGLLAMAPGITMAGPFSSLFKSRPLSRRAPAPNRSREATNQKIAEEIAAALRKGRISGYNIEIEVKSGIATLKGTVTDPAQRAKATKIVADVRGVRNVNNLLTLPQGNGPIQPVSHEDGRPGGIGNVNSAPLPPQGGPNGNQQMAEQIAAALKSANLKGYDIEIAYQNGTATLGGAVASPAQWAQATMIVSQIPGVQNVDNRLTVAGLPRNLARQPGPQPGPQPHPGGAPIHNVSYQGGPVGQPPAPPMNGGPSVTGMPMSAYGHGGPGMNPVMFNNPHLPEYAWPSYASYPNSAQISYPTQYSASAWPYIGPFYPYPQIPLGWRQAQLEWDDGYWSLNFRPRTDKWWWFMDPQKW